MVQKFPLRIETTRKSVHFYLDGIFLHTVPNELTGRYGYRYEHYNDCGHYDAYLRGNKISVTLKFLGDNGKIKSLKTYYTVPKRRVNDVMQIFKQVAEE